MNISIFGLGYVGAVSLACLARDGHRVIGVDVDRTKLALIAEGKTPVVEAGMVELVQQVV
ncbi:MAG: GDP-mannose dehydrogenase, partial [Burkholderiales bacterium]|nr:GDP-mannose dehydrogenase [Burkholderiales bacterium]